MKKITNKILLILDIDETLLHATTKTLERESDAKIFDYQVFIRPYLSEFFEEIQHDFDLAIWSSASDDYVKEVVKQILPNEIQWAFVWGRSRCTYKRNFESDDFGYYEDSYSNHYQYIKNLKKVKKLGYSIEKILIIDDTPHKSQKNYGNAIYPTEYLGQSDDDELKALSIYLKTFKDCPNVRKVEKRGWRSSIQL